MPQFLRDVEEIRDSARRNIEEGPVTPAYRGDKEQTISILNQALATEIVCVLRYMHHYFMATGVHGKSVADEFKEHADAERDHADQIAERVQQLGGKPDFDPKTLLQRSASQYIEGETLADMIREDLIAERVVIEVYTDMIRHFADNDPTTRVMLEGILKDEEEHAADLTDLLYIVDPHSGRTEGEDPGTHPLSLHPGEKRGEQGGGTAARGQRREALQQDRQQTRARAESRQQNESRDQDRNREQRTSRSAAQATEQFAGRGSAEVPPEHAPGTTGRPTRRQPQQTDQAEPRDVEADVQMGTNRSVHVTKPNRKRRVA